VSLKEIAGDSGLRIPRVKVGLQSLVRSGFLEIIAGAYSVVNWERYQPKLDNTVTERVQRHRELKRADPLP
jgi:hypothetical protein